MNQIRTLHRLLNDKFEEIERYDDLIAAYTKDASRLEVAKWKNEYLKIAAEYKATRERLFIEYANIFTQMNRAAEARVNDLPIPDNCVSLAEMAFN